MRAAGWVTLQDAWKGEGEGRRRRKQESGSAASRSRGLDGGQEKRGTAGVWANGKKPVAEDGAVTSSLVVGGGMFGPSLVVRGLSSGCIEAVALMRVESGAASVRGERSGADSGDDTWRLVGHRGAVTCLLEMAAPPLQGERGREREGQGPGRG